MIGEGWIRGMDGCAGASNPIVMIITLVVCACVFVAVLVSAHVHIHVRALMHRLVL